jgi:hypothetical protein
LIGAADIEVIMATGNTTRNPLLPWWIGLAIILAAIAYVGYLFTTMGCGPGTAGPLAFMVLGVMPAVYLVLMYMTLKSQSDSERP